MLQRFRTMAGGMMVLVLGMPVLSHAHSSLVGSEPRAGEVISTSPASVKVRFSKPPEPALSKVSVYDGENRQVDLGNSRVNDKDRNMVEVGVPPLSPGTYKVIWSIAGRDGHKMKGEFTFTIKAAP